MSNLYLYGHFPGYASIHARMDMLGDKFMEKKDGKKDLIEQMRETVRADRELEDIEKKIAGRKKEIEKKYEVKKIGELKWK